MNPYSSSLNDAEWAVIEPLLKEKDYFLIREHCANKFTSTAFC